MTADQPEPEDTEPFTSGVIRLMPPHSKAARTGAVLSFAWAGPDMEVTGDISRGDAGLAITRVEVTGPLPTGIAHHLLRRVPLGQLLAAGRAHLVDQDVISEPAPQPEPLPPGRVLMTPDLLRRVAQAYIEESGPGKDRAVLQRLEARFGRPKGTLRTWIAHARQEGWLGPAVQGRGGAEPGPRLMDWQLEEFKRQEPGIISHVQVDADGTVTDVSEPRDKHDSGGGSDASGE
ncbi:hypothetical protein ACFTZF_01100 [Streptomyces mirabilis]|uniref:hypothetical protein n=1 Tax=Streptomyces mirabilis TaxID=68239 RepID=UPI00363E6B2E